jgi:CubicO group peptidase (beta-lactamase class C family)
MLGLDLPDTAFGHPGAGGSLGFADPASGLAFGYVMNQMQLGLAGDPRSERLVSAAYASLAARKS